YRACRIHWSPRGITMRKLPVAITLVAALALSACGEENPPTQIKPADLDAEPEVFFAMKPCTCYEYAPEEEWAEGRQEFSAMLGVAVENLGAEVQFGRQLHIVRYRVSGTLNRVIRQEFLEPTDPELRSEEHTSELQSRENLVCRL